MVTVFDSGDQAYQAWLAANPNGYVVNTLRSMSPALMVLHRASCKSISSYNAMAQEGGFTERDYIKICAQSMNDLRDWVSEHGRMDRSFSNECSRCLR